MEREKVLIELEKICPHMDVEEYNHLSITQLQKIKTGLLAGLAPRQAFILSQIFHDQNFEIIMTDSSISIFGENYKKMNSTDDLTWNKFKQEILDSVKPWITPVIEWINTLLIKLGWRNRQ